MESESATKRVNAEMGWSTAGLQPAVTTLIFEHSTGLGRVHAKNVCLWTLATGEVSYHVCRCVLACCG